MKFIFIAIILFLSICTGFSQGDFYKGFIITNEGDSIYGQILSVGVVKQSKICSFKERIKDELIHYLPGEIKAYRLENGQYYISKIHLVNNEEIPLFLEYLVDGQVDLYYYMDDQMVNHFIVQAENGEMIELDNTERIVQVDGKNYTSTTKPYMGQLAYVYGDAPQIQEQLSHVSYNKKSLIKTAVNYHNKVCQSEECIVYEREPEKINFSMGPIFALNKSRSDYPNGLKTQPITMAWGASMVISDPETFKRFAFRYSIMYQEEDYNRDEKQSIVDGVFGQFYYSVASSGNCKYIENLFQIEFTIVYFGPFKLILNSGGYFNIWTQGEMSEYTSVYDTYLDETRDYTKFLEIERNRAGIVYGARLNCEVSGKISFYAGVDGFTHQRVIIGGSDYETNRIKFSLGMNFF